MGGHRNGGWWVEVWNIPVWLLEVIREPLSHRKRLLGGVSRIWSSGLLFYRLANQKKCKKWEPWNILTMFTNISKQTWSILVTIFNNVDKIPFFFGHNEKKYAWERKRGQILIKRYSSTVKHSSGMNIIWACVVCSTVIISLLPANSRSI